MESVTVCKCLKIIWQNQFQKKKSEKFKKFKKTKNQRLHKIARSICVGLTAGDCNTKKWLKTIENKKTPSGNLRMVEEWNEQTIFSKRFKKYFEFKFNNIKHSFLQWKQFHSKCILITVCRYSIIKNCIVNHFKNLNEFLTRLAARMPWTKWNAN